MSDRIKVGVKVRPLIERERRSNASVNWTVTGDNSICQIDPSTGRKKSEDYNYDHVFGPDSCNDEIFEVLAKPIVEATLKGFNGTIFAYGQTSSGKTYTMMGDKFEMGIIPKSIHYIFDLIEKTPNRQFLLRVCFIEIYNERLFDLLNERNDKLKISEDPCGNVCVKNASELVTDSPQMVLDLMRKGEVYRKIGETTMNVESSRSHSIFRIILESRDCSSDADDAVHVSHLNLVDLAGSERASATGASGERLKEGCSINRSLFMLGHVIQQLCDEETHVRFRDSKLTRMLQSSLGGNALTAVICAVTPAAVEETSSTLGFATRVGNVKNTATVNEVVSDAALLRRYLKQIQKLSSELDEIKGEKDNEKLALEKKNSELHERIDRLKSHLIVSSTYVSEPLDQQKKKLQKLRRRTWAASNRPISRYSLAPFSAKPCDIVSNLSSIKEDACRLSSSSVDNDSSVDCVNSATDFDMTDCFTTPLEEFEKELIMAERSHFFSANDSLIVSLEDNEDTREDISDKMLPEKDFICYVQTRKPPKLRFRDLKEQYSDQNLPGTPPEKLRQKAQQAEEELEEIRNFTKLEKQMFDEELSKQIKELKTENAVLKRELTNLQSHESDVAHLRSELESAQTCITNLENELDVLRSANPTACDFSLLLMDANKRSSQLQDDNKVLSEKLRIADEKCRNIEEIKSAMEKADREMKLLQNERKNVMESLKNKEMRLSQLESDKLDFDMSMSLIIQKHELKEKDLTEALQKAWAEIETNKLDTSLQSDGLENSITSIQSKYSNEALSEINALNEKISALVTENADLQCALKQSGPKEAQEDCTLTTRLSRKSLFVNSLCDLEEEPAIDELIHQVKALEDEKKSVNDKNNLLEQKVSDLNLQIQDYAKEIETLRDILKMANSPQADQEKVGQPAVKQNIAAGEVLPKEDSNKTYQKISSEEYVFKAEPESQHKKVRESSDCSAEIGIDDLLSLSSDKMDRSLDSPSNNSTDILNVTHELDDAKSFSASFRMHKLSRKAFVMKEGDDSSQHELNSCFGGALRNDFLDLVNDKQQLSPCPTCTAMVNLLCEENEKLKCVAEEKAKESDQFRELSDELRKDISALREQILSVFENDVEESDKSAVEQKDAGNDQSWESGNSSMCDDGDLETFENLNDEKMSLSQNCSDLENEAVALKLDLKQKEMELSKLKKENIKLIKQLKAKKLLEETGLNGDSENLKALQIELASKEEIISNLQEDKTSILNDLTVTKASIIDLNQELKSLRADQVLSFGADVASKENQTKELKKHKRISLGDANCEQVTPRSFHLEYEFSQVDVSCEEQVTSEIHLIFEENLNLQNQLKCLLDELASKEKLIARLEIEKDTALKGISMNGADLSTMQHEFESSKALEESCVNSFCDELNIETARFQDRRNLAKFIVPLKEKPIARIEAQKSYSEDINTVETLSADISQETESFIDAIEQNHVEVESRNDIFQENLMLQNQLKLLMSELSVKDKIIADLKGTNIISSERTTMTENALASFPSELECLKLKDIEKDGFKKKSERNWVEKINFEDDQKHTVEFSSGKSGKQNAVDGVIETSSNNPTEEVDLPEVIVNEIALKLDEMRAQNLKLQEQVTSLATELASKNNLISNLEVEFHNCLKDFDVEKAIPPEQRQKGDPLTGKKCHDLIKNNSEEYTSLGDQLKSLTAIIQNIEKEKHDIVKNVNSKEASLTKLIHELESVKTEASVKIAVVENTLDETREEKCSLRDQVQLLTAELATKEDEISMLKADKQTTVQNADDKDFNLANLIQEIESLKRAASTKTTVESTLVELREENDTLQGQLKALSDDIACKEEAIAKLENEQQIALQTFKNKECSLMSLLQEMELLKNDTSSKSTHLENSLCEMKEENVRLQDQIKSLTAEITSKEESFKRLEEEKCAILLDVKSKESHLSSLFQDIESLKTEASAKNTVLDSNLVNIREENIKLQEQCKVLTAEIATNQEVISRLRVENQDAVLQADSKAAKITVTENTLDEIREENSKLHNQLKVLSADFVSKEEIISRLELEKQTAVLTALEKDSSLTSLLHEMESVKHDSSAKIVIVENTLDALRKENSILQGQLRSLNDEVATKEKAILRIEEEKQLDLQNFESKQSSLESLLQEMESMRNETSTKYSDLEDAFCGLREENLSLKDQLQSLTSKVVDKEEIISRLETELKNAVDNIAIKEAASASLHQELESMKDEASKLKAHFEANLSEVNRKNIILNDQLNAQEESLAQAVSILKNNHDLKAELAKKNETILKLEENAAKSVLDCNHREASLENLCQQSEERYKLLQTRASSLLSDLSEKNEEIESLKTRISNLEILISNKDGDLEILKNSLEESSKQLHELRVALTKESKEKAALLHLKNNEKPPNDDSSVTMLQTKIDHYKKLLDQFIQERQVLKNHVKSLKEQSVQQNHSEDSAELKLIIQKQLETISNLQHEIASLHEKVNELDNDYEEMKSTAEHEMKTSGDLFEKNLLISSNYVQLLMKFINCEIAKALFIVAACKCMLKCLRNPDSESLFTKLAAKEIAARNSLARAVEISKGLNLVKLEYWTIEKIKEELTSEETVVSSIVEEVQSIWNSCESNIKEMGDEELLKMARRQEALAMERLDKINLLTDKVNTLSDKVQTLEVDLDVEKSKNLQLSKKSPLTAQFLAPTNSATAKKLEQLHSENRALREQLTVMSQDERNNFSPSTGHLCGACKILNEQLKELRINLADKSAEVVCCKNMVQVKNESLEKRITLLTTQLSDVQKKYAELKVENRKLAKTVGDVTFPQCVACLRRKKEMRSALVQTDEMASDVKAYSLDGAPSGIVDKFTESQWRERAMKLEQERTFFKQLCIDRRNQIKKLESQLQQS